MIFKGLLGVMFLWSSTALAAPSVTLYEESDIPKVRIDADQNKLSAFVNGNSLWVVSDGSDMVEMNIPTELRKKYSIQAGESLKVNGGSGSRIEFSRVPDIEIVDLPSKLSPISVIGLSEGLILSGVNDTKTLVAQSNLTGESFSVIPFASQSAQSPQKYIDRSQSFKTLSGYAFQGPNAASLNTLYRGRQQFLAQSKQALLDLAKKAPQQQTVLTTRKPEPVKIENEGVEVAPQKIAEIQEITESSKPKPLQALQTPSATVVEDKVAETVFEVPDVSKTASFENALSNIQEATARLKNIKAPEPLQKMRTENERVAEAAVIKVEKQKDVDDQFASFFGNDTAQESDFTKSQLEQETAQKRTVTYVEEVPDVNSDDEAAQLALQVLGNTDTFKQETKSYTFDDANEFEDEEFKIPDLDPNEPIFKRYGDGSNEVYLKYQHKLLDELALAPSQIKRQQYRLRLAKVYMSYERPHEVLMMMDNMPKDPDTGMIIDTSARILSGAADIMIGRPAEAMEFLNIESDNFEDDRHIWLAAAYELTDNDSKALDLYEKYIQVADGYPKHLIQELYISYGRLLLRQERLSELKALMKEMNVKMRQQVLPPEALMLLARAAIIERNDPLAETLLSQAAASDNEEVSFLAQYEFVSFLLSRGDLGVNQAIEHLENLRYLWRGGYVEQEILKKLGYMYINRGEQRKGLERLKYHNIYFPHTANQEQITELMMTAFSDLYLDETAISKLDPLALLGLYYDYRELTPPGEKGDKLIAQIGDRLRNLGLFDRAIEVLEGQLKYRVKDPIVKGEMGRNLALIYYLNKNFEESLNALVRTESPNLNADLTRSRQYIEAENYIELGELDKAQGILKGIDEARATKLLADIGWMQDEYSKVVNEYEKIYDNPKNLPYEWSEEDKLGFVRLAVAYNNLGRLRDLESLIKRYDQNLRKDDNIMQVTQFLMKDRGSDIVSPIKDAKSLWEKLTNSLSAYHDFADYYDKLVQEREMDRRDKDIFNRRMRQISAPARY